VGPPGRRNIDELLALAIEVNAKNPVTSPPLPAERKTLSKDAVLYVREGCRFCAAVLRAAENLHCTNAFRVRDVSKDPDARRDLDALAGEGAKVPALVEGGKVMQESGDIIRSLAEMYARY
jgi:glutaredoxin